MTIAEKKKLLEEWEARQKRNERAAPRFVRAFARRLFTHRDLVDRALEEARTVHDPRTVQDLAYRIFHNSFKAYRLGALSSDLVERMLLPLGEAPDPAMSPRSRRRFLVERMRRWHLDERCIRFFIEGTPEWSMARNPKLRSPGTRTRAPSPREFS